MTTSRVLDSAVKADHLYMPEDHMDDLYSCKNPLVRFVHVGRLDAIVGQIPKKNGLRILDAGCGEGHLLERLHNKYPDQQYYGADITDVALEQARGRCPFAELSRTNLMQTGFPDEFFDVVTCTEVIEHIYEYAEVIKELKRIIKREGRLIMTFPNEVLWTISRFFLGRRPIKVPDHVNAFNPRRMNYIVNLKIKKQLNLPFGLPFAFSLNGLMNFVKEAP